MKRQNWSAILLILASIAVFCGYEALSYLRTDTQAPKIQLEGQIPEVSVQDPRSALLQGVTATDDVDGDVTDSLVVERVNLLGSDGHLMVHYAAFDNAGNVAKIQREARYTDYESPRFTLNGPLLYPAGSTFDVLNTVGAEDIIDGDIQHRVRAVSQEEESIASTGTHNVQFQVTNSLGETVTQVLPVEVYNDSMYEAELTLTDYLVYLEKGEEFDPEDYLDTFWLHGEDTVLKYGLPEDYSLKISGTVHTRIPGTYSVKYRVTFTEVNERDPEEVWKYIGYSKLIVVVEGKLNG